MIKAVNTKTRTFYRNHYNCKDRKCVSTHHVLQSNAFFSSSPRWCIYFKPKKRTNMQKQFIKFAFIFVYLMLVASFDAFPSTQMKHINPMFYGSSAKLVIFKKKNTHFCGCWMLFFCFGSCLMKESSKVHCVIIQNYKSEHANAPIMGCTAFQFSLKLS